ncbi:protein GIGAS CELL1 [Beta vulgaris subsp. vulgaris]|uniref:protein GIGAS CELL1 n=1 Tax=Beta vulgaris subsp. vulgaris TaxID=3555 RepID=UPI0020369150|nr:protein GIGAS CELL1 [Beta vulgaris subsp. vulgaris]
MNASRDRLSRPVDISSLLQNAERRVDLVVDEPGLHWLGLSPQSVSTSQSGGASGKSSRRRVGLQKYRHRRYISRSLLNQENQRPRSVRKGQGRGSILPSWYPRTPLRDITAIVRAIERKRAELRDNDQMIESPQQETNSLDTTTELNNEMSISTPPQACKFKDDNASKKGKDIEFFTPQKKLLNSIEKVRHIWLEDQRKLERTPAAKKAERKKMVRVLMSMR